MTAREDRLAPATRNYVIFGLLFVVAIGLAICDWTNPRRGEADSPLRVMVVSTHADGPASTLADVDGFVVAQVSPSEAIERGRELLDDEQAPRYLAAITYADQLGFGFVALDLRDEDDQPFHWALSEEVPSSARFAVFSVGDVAIESPRMRSVGMPEGLIFDPRLAAIDSLRLALYEHPDLTRLWTKELSAIEVQARSVLAHRRLDERRTLLSSDHAAWKQLDQAWPTSETIAGTLAGPWERVQAAPIPGGLLLEVRPVRVRVDAGRRPRLELAEEATLEFLPRESLTGAGQPNGPARHPCEGLPERVRGAVTVAPDGSAVAIAGPLATTLLFVFEPPAVAPGEEEGGAPNREPAVAPQAEPRCRARSIGALATGERAVGRPSAAGSMAWNYDDDWLHWWSPLGEHREQVLRIDGYSGPWWVDRELLALIGERPLAELGYEPVVLLLDTKTSEDPRVRIELGADELFGEPDLALIDLRPAGDALLLVTERCPGPDADEFRPCLHRVSPAQPDTTLTTLVREIAAGLRGVAESITVETLGPIDPHVELAVAAGGSRVAWINQHAHALMVADLRVPDRISPRRIDPDPNPEASLRISADGRVVLAEIEVELTLGRHSLGSLRIPRAFVLEPPP